MVYHSMTMLIRSWLSSSLMKWLKHAAMSKMHP